MENTGCYVAILASLKTSTCIQRLPARKGTRQCKTIVANRAAAANEVKQIFIGKRHLT
jgi:hypothetical protein